MTASFKIDAEHPWPWLDAFPEYAEQFFNGRDDEKQALFRCMLSAPVSVLFGKSGLGKSSLLQAGLFPQLRNERLLPVYVRLLHDQNAPELCAQLAKRFSEEIHKTQAADAASPPLNYRYRQQQEDEDAEPIILTDELWADLHRSDIELVDETGKRWQPVFVLDQFEEIFTLGGQNPNRQTHCFYQLGDFLENRIPKALAERLNQDDELFDQLNPDSQAYRFLLSLREDYLPDLEEWSELIPRLSPNRFRLLPMTAQQAIAAVQKTGGDLVTPQDAENIVEYLSANQTAGQQKRRGVTQIEPALLGLMCAGLNEDRLRNQKSRLKTDNLTLEGGLIVERFYDQAFTDLPASVRDFVEQHLITSDGVRLAYPVRSMETEKLATAAQLNTLVDKRLLRRESLEEGDRIELVHDRLAQVALQRRRENLQRRESEKQQKKRLRWLMGFASLLLLVMIFAVYMWQAESKAKRAWMEATATRLAIEGSSITAGLRQGSTITGLFKVLAGHRLARVANGGEALLDEVLQSEYLKFKNLVSLWQQPSAIVSVAINTNGDRIAKAYDDNTIQIWDAQTHQPIGQPLRGHQARISSIAFSPDGSRIVSVSRDATLRLWDAHTGKPIGQQLTNHQFTHSTNNSARSPSEERDRAFARLEFSRLQTESAIVCVSFSPDGHLVVSGSKDKTLQIWNAENGQPLGGALVGHSDTVSSVTFSPDGNRIVSGSEDETLRIWDTKTSQPIGKALFGHQGSVLSVAFSKDGNRIVSGSEDKTLRIWDARTGQSIGKPLSGHLNSILSVAFNADGNRIVSGSSDKTIRVWNAKTGQSLGDPFSGHQGPVLSVTFNPNSSHIFSSSTDNSLRIWNTDTDSSLGPLLTGHMNAVTSVAFSPDGSRIVSGSMDKTLRLWDAESGQPIGLPFTGNSEPISSVAFSPDGNHIVSFSASMDFPNLPRHLVDSQNFSSNSHRHLMLWNANSRQPINQSFIGNTDSVYSVVFSPDGSRIVVANSDNTLRIWDIKTSQAIGQPLKGHQRPVSSAAYSQNGNRIVSGSLDNTLRLWDAKTGQALGEPIIGHQGNVLSVAFSPDNTLIVSGGLDKTLRLWDTNTRKLIGLAQTDYPITSAAFSPNASRIVSGDGALRLWDSRSFQPIGQTLKDAQHSYGIVAFNPDGKHIVSGSLDGTLRIWPVFEGWADELCQKLGRNMNHKEWREWVSPDIDYIEQCPGLPVPPNDPDNPVVAE